MSLELGLGLTEEQTMTIAQEVKVIVAQSIKETEEQSKRLNAADERRVDAMMAEGREKVLAIKPETSTETCE